MQNKKVSEKHITVCGVPVLLERKKIKTLRLGVKAPGGHVHISAPVKVPEETVISFVKEKIPWIKKQQEKITAMSRNMADESDREVLRELIDIILPKWERVTGLSCSAWQIRDMKTRWGTCNTQTGKIWFSLQLARQPIECIEYVVLHELIHLKIPGHGKDFKDMLDLYMPEWRDRRREMNG